MTGAPDIAAARLEVERTRLRLLDTAHQLQDRLSPKVLAKDAWQGAKDKGADLAEDAVDAVRARPLAATGVVAAVTMFLAREPLMDLAGRLAGAVTSKRKAKTAKTTKTTAKTAQTTKTTKTRKPRTRAHPTETVE